MSKGKLEQVSAACHHLGFFNNAGLSAHYKLSESSSPAVADLRGLVYAAAGDLLRKHRILFAIPVNEGTPNPHFACLPWIDLRRSIAFLERSVPLASAAEEQDKELDAILEEQHNIDFQTDYGTLPFWRLIILRSKGRNDFTASFIYHHAIGDGVSGLAFHKAFCNALEAASSSTLPPDRAENIIGRMRTQWFFLLWKNCIPCQSARASLPSQQQAPKSGRVPPSTSRASPAGRLCTSRRAPPTPSSRSAKR